MPERIQMSRQRPWRHEHTDAVIVARPTKWGNPWRVWRDPLLKRWICQPDHSAHSERFHTKREAIAAAVAHFEWWAKHRMDTSELRGLDLACWCALDEPCHADVLLELANG